MKKMLVTVVLALSACSYEAGECWVRGEGEDGAGGGVIIGGGAFDLPLFPPAGS